MLQMLTDTHDNFRMKIPCTNLWKIIMEISQLILFFGKCHLLSHRTRTRANRLCVSFNTKILLSKSRMPPKVCYVFRLLVILSFITEGSNNSFYATTTNNILPKHTTHTHTHSSINYLSFLVTLQFFFRCFNGKCN